jgi:hypothetical protein
MYMHKKIFALILAVNCMNNQCRDISSEQVKLAQIKAAEQALQNLNNRTSRAYMGTAITTFGLAGTLGIMACGKSDELFVVGVCGVTVAGGLLITFLGENEQGNPQERARLIAIIENAGSSESANNTQNIVTK